MFSVFSVPWTEQQAFYWVERLLEYLCLPLILIIATGTDCFIRGIPFRQRLKERQFWIIGSALLLPLFDLIFGRK